MTNEDVMHGACPKHADGSHTESWWDGGVCDACGHSAGNVVEVTDKESSGDLPPGEGEL